MSFALTTAHDSAYGVRTMLSNQIPDTVKIFAKNQSHVFVGRSKKKGALRTLIRRILRQSGSDDRNRDMASPTPIRVAAPIPTQLYRRFDTSHLSSLLPRSSTNCPSLFPPCCSTSPSSLFFPMFKSASKKKQNLRQKESALDPVDDVALAAHEARELLRWKHKRTHGRTAEELLTKPATSKGDSSAADEDDEDPWKLKEGGLVERPPAFQTLEQKDVNIARKSIFQSTTQSSGALHMEKQMQSYIEEEVKRQLKAEEAAQAAAFSAADALDPGSVARPVLPTQLVPTEEPTAPVLDHDQLLFDLPDELKQETSSLLQAKRNEKDIAINVSMGQLSRVPEVDLGAESRDKIAQETERVQEQWKKGAYKKSRALVPEEGGFFFRKSKRQIKALEEAIECANDPTGAAAAAAAAAKGKAPEKPAHTTHNVRMFVQNGRMYRYTEEVQANEEPEISTFMRRYHRPDVLHDLVNEHKRKRTWK